MNGVTDIRYVGYAVRNLEDERRFYRDVWKLNEVAEEDGLIYFAAAGAPEGEGMPQAGDAEGERVPDDEGMPEAAEEVEGRPPEGERKEEEFSEAAYEEGMAEESGDSDAEGVLEIRAIVDTQ